MGSFARMSALLLAMMVAGLLLSCCRKKVYQVQGGKSGQSRQTATLIASPKPNTIITSGDAVKIEIKRLRDDIEVDSVAVTVGNTTQTSSTGSLDNLFWSSVGSRVGQNTLRIRIYYNDSLQDSHNVGLVILSDIVPGKYSYRIVRQYPHDDQAFTQGLVFDNGHLYESTGLESKSSIRIVDIPTGKIVRMATLATQYFGEGIALFNDQIFQITWKSQTGFVYDKNTLQQIRTFDYRMSEGWGLATDGRNLIMSDGSAKLFFLEPEFFTQVDQLEVFDNKGLINSLNELEYVGGKILANIYGQTYIVIIDPLTGKVTGRLDLQKLIPEGSRDDYNKVLNGIAYNPRNGHLYITGKNWPYLYEIELNPPL